MTALPLVVRFVPTIVQSAGVQEVLRLGLLGHPTVTATAWVLLDPLEVTPVVQSILDSQIALLQIYFFFLCKPST